MILGVLFIFFFKQKTAYEMRISDWSSDVCSSDLPDRPEEFPSFTNFWFAPSAGGSDRVTVHALLDGPSLAGVFRFDMQRASGVVMDIDCSLFLRRDVARLGIAPATSMFWFSETLKQTAVDWRPEVHDSDGLAMWNGAGERIWRQIGRAHV